MFPLDVYAGHSKLKIINDDINLYKKMERYKDMLANMRHGIEYMVSFIIAKKSPQNAFDDLYSKIEALRQQGFIDRNQASVFHKIRILANSSGSHLEQMAGEETITAFSPYMREVENFLLEYGFCDKSQGIGLGDLYNDNQENKIETYSPSFIYTTCRYGIRKAEEQFSNKKIMVSGVVSAIYPNRITLSSTNDDTEVFVSVDLTNKHSFVNGQKVSIIGTWQPPSVASIRFGNAGTIKETKI